MGEPSTYMYQIVLESRSEKVAFDGDGWPVWGNGGGTNCRRTTGSGEGDECGEPWIMARLNVTRLPLS
jgi:hypothetical protein